MQFDTLTRAAFEELWKRSGFVYAALEPAAWPDLTRSLSMHECEYAIMYEGFPLDNLRAHLPRLALVPWDSSFCGELLDAVGAGAGVFLAPAQKKADLCAMTQHMARLCNVLTPEGDFAWLRWYEPYVLRALLENATEDGLSLMYGETVGAFLAEIGRTGTYARFANPLPPDRRKQGVERLRVTPVQLEAMNESHYRLFLDELEHRFHENFYPHEPALPEETRERIEELCDLAQWHGLTDMASMARLAELGLRTRWQCVDMPEARAFLTGERVSPQDALDSLETYCRDHGLYNESFPSLHLSNAETTTP